MFLPNCDTHQWLWVYYEHVTIVSKSLLVRRRERKEEEEPWGVESSIKWLCLYSYMKTADRIFYRMELLEGIVNKCWTVKCTGLPDRLEMNNKWKIVINWYSKFAVANATTWDGETFLENRLVEWGTFSFCFVDSNYQIAKWTWYWEIVIFGLCSRALKFFHRLIQINLVLNLY